MSENVLLKHKREEAKDFYCVRNLKKQVKMAQNLAKD